MISTLVGSGIGSLRVLPFVIFGQHIRHSLKSFTFSPDPHCPARSKRPEVDDLKRLVGSVPQAPIVIGGCGWEELVLEATLAQEFRRLS